MDIELSQNPALYSSYNKKQPHRGMFRHGAECFLIIKAFPLCIALGHQTNFVSFYRSISLNFILQTHLQPTTRLPVGRGTTSHMWLSVRAESSTTMAFFR
ncbi:hypothetical protein MLD38_036397 [Melastoma candidum]|uniref:Uncharacterized protein n=1 Tax=Melastoma candidum TaxID=119954 RepID=A0ACB9LJF4_9MYRT|nr:hypothetical protein MLD38_036397 [Melastoma candidum]